MTETRDILNWFAITVGVIACIFLLTFGTLGAVWFGGKVARWSSANAKVQLRNDVVNKQSKALQEQAHANQAVAEIRIQSARDRFRVDKGRNGAAKEFYDVCKAQFLAGSRPTVCVERTLAP
jgi:hypothetical protein